MRKELIIIFLSVACTQSSFSGDGKARNPTKKGTPQSILGDSGVGNQDSNSLPLHMFSTAILTKSVQCLFCHMRIEGDVGGIDFPGNQNMHERSGEGLRIIGTLFATNQVPDRLASVPQTQNTISFYQNSDIKIFPASRDLDGKVTFPVVTPSQLQGKTKGVLKAGSVVVNGSYTGSLTLMGIDTPITVNGEVFIDGDLIIGGNYSGLGTIYARNIFIVRDLKAVNSAFPFPIEQDLAKKVAIERISAKADGLYLMALGQITVGYPDEKFIADGRWKSFIPADPSLTNPTPSNLASYVGLAQPKVCKKVSTDPNHSKNYQRVIVNHVDAFLYAADYLLWRTCDSFTLNGGFIAPNVAIVNAGDAGPKLDSEPTNVVRYDYRLRAGINAFSLLRQFFEKE